MLQTMIDSGVLITIATGRTCDSALQAIHPLKLNLPIISDNGTLIYDTQNECYIKKHFIDINIVTKIVNIAQKHDVMPFVNSLRDTQLTSFYSELNTEAMKRYYSNKLLNKTSNFVKDTSYTQYKSEEVFNISMLNTHENLSLVLDAIKNYSMIQAEFFPSHYYPGYWWLEVLPQESGKGSALDILKEIIKPDRTICFGDNLNDINLFKHSDYSIATENAVPEVKKMVDEVIGHSNDDSVALYIKKHNLSLENISLKE